MEALKTAREAAGLGRDELEIKPVGCLRLCGLGPLLATDGPGGTALYGAVPPDQAAEAILEVADARIGLIVCVTSRVPVWDMVQVKAYLRGKDVNLIGRV